VRDVMTEILLRNPADKPAFVASNQAVASPNPVERAQ
jgi:hypothetical protein